MYICMYITYSGKAQANNSANPLGGVPGTLPDKFSHLNGYLPSTPYPETRAPYLGIHCHIETGSLPSY